MRFESAEIDKATREEVLDALESVIENFDDFDVTEIEKWGDAQLRVTLDSLEHFRQMRIEIDDMP